MIPLNEAACPKCFNATDIAYPLKFEANSKTYTCTYNAGHKFEEDTNGFLKGKLTQ